MASTDKGLFPTLLGPSPQAWSFSLTYPTEFHWRYASTQTDVLLRIAPDWEKSWFMKQLPDGSWSCNVPLPPGTHLFKFVVDGHWVYDADLPIIKDEEGNTNNYVHVEEPPQNHPALAPVTQTWEGTLLESIPHDLFPLLHSYQGSLCSVKKHYKFKTKFGRRGEAQGEFQNPTGLKIDRTGTILVVDTWNHRIQRFQDDGSYLGTFGKIRRGPWGQQEGFMAYPYAIAVDSFGHLIVVNNGTDSIVVLDPSGEKIIMAFGGHGKGNGQFNGAEGVVLDAENMIYVADRRNDRIQIFTRAGAWYKNVPCQGCCGVAVDGEGNIYGSDTVAHRIKVFSPTGELKKMIGAPTIAVTSPLGVDEALYYPWGIALDFEGNVVVCDNQNHRIQIYSKEGTNLMRFGSLGGKDGEMNYPMQVAIDKEGNILVADFHNHRIQVFGGT